MPISVASSFVMWLVEHGDEEDSGGESDIPPPIPPREEPLMFPLTLEQTLALEGGAFPSAPAPAVTSTPAANATVPAPPAISAKTESDKFLEALFPDVSLFPSNTVNSA